MTVEAKSDPALDKGYDFTLLPRSQSEWESFVLSLAAGSVTDEADWIEWKSTLDLSRKEGQFAVAKCIIAMHNREENMDYINGYGVMVIGVSPDDDGEPIQGVRIPDTANLYNELERYLDGQVKWTPHRVVLGSVHVLCLAVCPPKEGNRIASLAKAYDKHDEGTIFVRNGSRSAPATRKDLNRLQDRLINSRPDLTLEVSAGPGYESSPISWSGAEIVVGREERDLLSTLTSGDEKAREWCSVLEGRSEEEFRAQVDTYLEALEESLPGIAMATGQAHLKKVCLRIFNPEVMNLQGVLIELKFPEWVVVARERANEYPILLPKRPAQWGTMQAVTPLAPTFISTAVESTLEAMTGTYLDGPHSVQLELGHVRPRDDFEEETSFVLIHTENDATSIPVTYKMSATSLDSFKEGSFQIPIAKMPLNVAASMMRIFD